jgi:hypothetical protein
VDVSPDFKDLLRCLNGEGAEFLVVGGYAVIFHTEPRFTKDLDVWVRPTAANADKIWRALSSFGAPLVGVTSADFAKPGNFYAMGRAPHRIDVITSIAALDFDDAWRNRVRGTYGGEPAHFLSVADLVRNKRAVARPQDLLDVEKLENWSRGTAKKRRGKRR